MPIPTSRTSENGQITIDNNLCNGCGLCVEVCGDQSLEMHNGKAIQSQTPVFGCFACGQCMAVCPRDAIVVEGRTLSANDIFPLAPGLERASYSQLLNLLQARRSVRKFKDKTVDKELIGKVVDAARTAPIPKTMNAGTLPGLNISPNIAPSIAPTKREDARTPPETFPATTKDDAKSLPKSNMRRMRIGWGLSAR